MGTEHQATFQFDWGNRYDRLRSWYTKVGWSMDRSRTKTGDPHALKTVDLGFVADRSMPRGHVRPATRLSTNSLSWPSTPTYGGKSVSQSFGECNVVRSHWSVNRYSNCVWLDCLRAGLCPHQRQRPSEEVNRGHAIKRHGLIQAGCRAVLASRPHLGRCVHNAVWLQWAMRASCMRVFPRMNNATPIS